MRILEPLTRLVSITIILVFLFSIVSFFGFIVSQHKQKEKEKENNIEILVLTNVDELKDENKLNSLIDRLQENKTLIIQLDTINDNNE